MKITKTNGFTLLELMIVLTIFGIMASTASFYMGRYTKNTDLRAAARQLATDMANVKQRSVTEGLNYRMTITVGTPGNYTIERRNAANTASTVIATKSPTDESRPGVSISSTTYGTNIILFLPRGTTSAGRVVLQNNIGSTATITSNDTGKTHVTFTMQ